MAGYIINLYKNATSPSNQKSMMKEQFTALSDSDNNNQDQPQHSLLVYGDFDKLTVKKIMNFSRYRDVEKYARNWFGPRQSLLVYELGGETEKKTGLDSVRSSGDLLQEIADSKGTKICDAENFVIITMVTLDPAFHRSQDFGGMLAKCKSLISDQIDKVVGQAPDLLNAPSKIKYQVYGSFSSTELIIVWFSEQYSDVLRLVDCLRDLKFTVSYKENVAGKAEEVKKVQKQPFLSFYSIISQPKPAPGSDLKLDIVGDAEVKFIFQDDQSGPDNYKRRDEYFRKLIKEFCDGMPANFNHCAGEYDCSIRMSANKLCNRNIFHNGSWFHWSNDEFSRFVTRTHTQLYYKPIPSETLSELNLESRDLCCVYQEENPYDVLRAIKEYIYGKDFKGGLRSTIKKRFPETDGLCDTIDLLYSDYVNNCSNLINTSWACDLSAQFLAVIDYISHQIYRHFDLHRLRSTDLFRDIKGVANDFKQIIYHIAQSRRTIFVVPSCHLRYMGQYDMILHAYYGLEKYYLSLAYQLKSNDYQPELMPLFTVDVVPEIKTYMYKYNKVIESEEPELKTKTCGIFALNLPLSAMGDFLRYSVVICHETSHFITPRDRNKRNQAMGMLYFSYFVARLAVGQLYLSLDGELREDVRDNYKRLDERIEIRLIPLIYDGLRDFFFNHIHAQVEDEWDSNGNEKFPNWNFYDQTIRNKIMSFLTDATQPHTHEILYKFLYDNTEAFKSIIDQLIEGVDKRARVNLYPQDQREDFVENILKLISTAPEDGGCDIFFSKSTELLINSGAEAFFGTVKALSDGYREACQDLPMIRMFNFSLSDYLVFRDRHRNDILQLGKPMPRSEAYRTAMISDYLLECQSDVNTRWRQKKVEFDSFREDYVKLFGHVPEIVSASGETKEPYLGQIEEAFKINKDAYNVYCEEYSQLRSLFIEQLGDSDLLKSKEISGKLDGPLPGYYQTWKAAILSGSPTSEEVIFENNVKMIQEFQNQKTFFEISEG